MADSRWKGQICSRPGSHVYNRGIMASVLAAHGEEKAEEWAKKLVSNFAKRPQGNDRAQVKAIYEGECNIALINNYYFGKLKFAEDPEQRKWVENTKLRNPMRRTTKPEDIAGTIDMLLNSEADFINCSIIYSF